MSIITVAVIIVAATLGGGTHWLTGRSGGGPSLAFALGLLVGLLVYASGGAVLEL